MIPNQKKTPKNSRTSAFQIKRQKQIQEALDYRLQGHSYPKIAEAMGLRPTQLSTVYDWVVEGMARIIREPAEKLREMELERIDLLLAAHFADAAGGDMEKTSTVLRVMDRRAKLLGLDAPTKTEVTGVVATAAMSGHAPSDNDRARQLAAFIAMTRARKEAEKQGEKE